MSKWLESEKQRQASFKQQSAYFSEAARQEGIFKNKLRPFCLPESCAAENLYAPIRADAIDYFAQNKIGWHQGKNDNPSNHLCDSQVCCVNFLFPLASQPDALAALLRPLFPTIHRMAQIDGQFVAFEWIGQENYLNEMVRGQRTRGKNFTSADAVVMFERSDGQREIILIEWKYTESYSVENKKIAKSGTDRSQIYAHLFERDDCPLDKATLPHYDSLFYEPFYQFMRQQFLAHEMERAREFNADSVRLLHIAPAHNRDFQRVTSPDLHSLGDNATDVWKRLVKPSDRFISISTESLFGAFPIAEFPALMGWWDYIHQRYAWMNTL
jgi:hypothetical protein